MKHAPEQEYISFSGSRLFLDDYRRLIEILQKSAFPLSVQVDEFVLDSPEEISALPRKSVRNLTIHTDRSADHVSGLPELHVSLTLSGPRAHVHLEGDLRAGSAIRFELLELLKMRRSRFLAFWVIILGIWPGLVYALALFLLPFTVPPEQVRALPLRMKALVLLFVIAGGVLAIVKTKLWDAEHSLAAVTLRDRESGKLFGLDREKIILVVVTVVLTLIGQAAIRWFFGK